MITITNQCIFFRAGGKAGAVKSCSNCNGRGVKVTIRHIGPGMVQQMQSACNVCRGEGGCIKSLVAMQTLQSNYPSQ